jgi:hypothetical protein
MHKHTIVYGFWFYQELLSLIGSRPYRKKMKLITPNGFVYSINTYSSRLRCLKRSPVCVACGKVGEVWFLESILNNGVVETPPHLNLYAIVKNKNHQRDGLTLMTQDHIVPRAHFGSSAQINLQTLCCNCNNDKGCALDWHGGKRPQVSHVPSSHGGDTYDEGSEGSGEAPAENFSL